MLKKKYKQLLKSEIQLCQEKLNEQKDKLNTFLCMDLKNGFSHKINGIPLENIPLHLNNGNSEQNLQREHDLTGLSPAILKELIHTCVQYIESQNFLLQGISNYMEIGKRYTVEEIDKAYNLIDNTALTIYNNDHLLHIINTLIKYKRKIKKHKALEIKITNDNQ